MTKTPVIINGKFLLASLEGMPRVGREITRCFDALVEEPAYHALDIRIAVPRGGGAEAYYKNIPVEEIGRWRGFLWEQIDLPAYLGGRYSLHFTNTAPVLSRQGCVVIHDAQFMSSRASHTLKSFLLYKSVTPLVAKRYSTIVTVSEYSRGELLRYGVCGRRDVHVIPNGADHVLRHQPDTAILDRFGLAPGDFALANSYVHAHKNVSILLEAFASPALAGRTLALFGSSRREEYLERGIAVPDNVVFLGRVSDAELTALMQSARMFLFPSKTEGFGLPPLEAMFLGCPTVCARAGAMPANCGDGVLYAAPESAPEWTDQILRLWTDDDEHAAFSAAGRARAERFRWETAARAYLDLILAATAPRTRAA
jgi:glycosyltransferase involved in cell wall biosynthesis